MRFKTNFNFGRSYMKYVLQVNTANTEKVQRALFKLGFSWKSGKKEVQYTHWYALVLEDYSKEISYSTISKTSGSDYTKLSVDDLLKTERLVDSNKNIIKLKEKVNNPLSKAHLTDLVGMHHPSIEQKYVYYPDTSSQAYIVAVIACSGTMAWIKSSSVLPNGKTSDIVPFNELAEMDARDAQEAEVVRIINNVQHTQTAAKHIVTFMTKQFENTTASTSSKLPKLLDSFENSNTDIHIYAKSKLVKDFLMEYKNLVISRKDIITLLGVSNRVASSVLEYLTTLGKIQLTAKSNRRRYYIVK